MKKILLTVLTLTLCFAMLAGCAESEPAETNEPVQAESGSVISPLPETISIDNLDNCTVFVSLEEGDAFVDDQGAMQMKVKVYSYELYDMVDIAELKEGDTIIRQGEEIEITELTKNELGLISINGGQEKGGFDLYSHESTVYYEIGFNDAKAFYELGEVTLPVSTEFVYLDKSDLDAEAKEYYPGDFLTDDAGIVYDFIPYNTSITIEDGKVIGMNKHYIP